MPHLEQVPFTAGLSLFSLTFFGSFISLFFLHFTQYAVVISIHQFLGGNEILRPCSLNYNYAIKSYIILIFDAFQSNLIKLILIPIMREKLGGVPFEAKKEARKTMWDICIPPKKITKSIPCGSQ